MLTERFKDFFSNFSNRDDEEYDDEYYEDQEYDDDEFDEREEGDDIVQNKINFPWQKNKVVQMSNENQQSIKMKIVKPTSFEQTKDVCNLLRDKNSIVLNFEYVQKDTARRFLDYISGAVDFAQGSIEKVSNSVFVVAPYNYEIVNDTKEQKFETKMAAPWR